MKFKNKKIKSSPQLKGLWLTLNEFDYGSEEIEKQMPIECRLIHYCYDMNRKDYILAECKKPLHYKDKEYKYLIVGLRFFGYQLTLDYDLAYNVAIVIDESQIYEDALCYEKSDYVAICIGRLASENIAKEQRNEKINLWISISLFVVLGVLLWIVNDFYWPYFIVMLMGFMAAWYEYHKYIRKEGN